MRVRSAFGRQWNFNNGSAIWDLRFSDDGQWIRIRGWDTVILSTITGSEVESNRGTAFEHQEDDVCIGWYDVANQLIWLPSYLQGKVWENGDLIVFGARAMAICQVNEIG